jgi:6-phosphogluconate dehydrogenase (decarboxylating)
LFLCSWQKNIVCKIFIAYISVQMRREENLLDMQGAIQCGSEGYWTNQDVSIPATGTDAPALVIIIK